MLTLCFGLGAFLGVCAGGMLLEDKHKVLAQCIVALILVLLAVCIATDLTPIVFRTMQNHVNQTESTQN